MDIIKCRQIPQSPKTNPQGNIKNMKLPFLHQEVEVIAVEHRIYEDSNDILDNPDALKERIAADGYLLIRDLHDKEAACSRHDNRFLEKLHSERHTRTGKTFNYLSNSRNFNIAICRWI